MTSTVQEAFAKSQAELASAQQQLAHDVREAEKQASNNAKVCASCVLWCG
jgi:hypothetical protein